MIDAAAFFDKSPNGELSLRPTLRPLAEGNEGDDSGESEAFVQLSDEQCLLASGVLGGFDFKTKDWCKWNPAFARLPSPSLLTTYRRPVPCGWNSRHHL